MTEQSPREPDWVPEACTLPTAELPLRLAEFDALFSRTVRDHERLTRQHLRVTLSGGEELAATVRDLADRETQCCSFFTFSTGTPQAGTVQLDIEVPAGHTEVLDALEDRATAVRSGQ